MGTNYYLIRPACEHCGRGGEPLHIGKSSAGWCFGLHVYPDAKIVDIDDWQMLMEADSSTIEDEFGKSVSPKEMISIIRDRSWTEVHGSVPYGYQSIKHFCRDNYADPGPNGLFRHRVDGYHCVGHGVGTWDYIVGEFS